MDVEIMNRRYRQADKIVTRKVMNETLLVPISGELALMDSLYSLNDTSRFIWQALDGKTTLAEITKLLENEYEGASEGELEGDLLDIVFKLEEIGLVQLGEGER